ncbi:hypothetical protein E4U59_002935 [Claviceps monticola]|nr:hypothetical protein E4U59_002935 [Claviceps monticola]
MMLTKTPILHSPIASSDQSMLPDGRPSTHKLLLHMWDTKSMQVSSGLRWYLWVDAFDTSAIRQTGI